MLLSRQTSQVLSPDGRLPYLPAIRPAPHNSIKGVDSAVDVDRNGLRHTIKHDEGMLRVRQGGDDGCDSHVYLHAGQQQQRQNHPSHLDQVQTHIEQHFVTPMHRPPNVRSPRPPTGPAIALEDQFPFLKDGRKRTRKLLTPEQTRFLESILEKTAYPSTVTRNAVASILNVSPRKVQVWFQNKRQGHRRQTNACNGQKSFKDPSSRVDGILQRDPRIIDDGSTCHDAALTASSLPGPNQSGVAPQIQRMTHTFWDDRFSDQRHHRQQQQYMASQSMKFDSVDHSRRLYGVESSPPSHTISRTRFDVSSASSSSSSSPPSPSVRPTSLIDLRRSVPHSDAGSDDSLLLPFTPPVHAHRIGMSRPMRMVHQSPATMHHSNVARQQHYPLQQHAHPMSSTTSPSKSFARPTPYPHRSLGPVTSGHHFSIRPDGAHRVQRDDVIAEHNLSRRTNSESPSYGHSRKGHESTRTIMSSVDHPSRSPVERINNVLVGDEGQVTQLRGQPNGQVRDGPHEAGKYKYQVEHDKEPSFARQEQLPSTTLEANILPPILDSRLVSRTPSPSTVFKTGQMSASTIPMTQNSSPSKSPLTLPSVAELLALR